MKIVESLNISFIFIVFYGINRGLKRLTAVVLGIGGKYEILPCGSGKRSR
jgi:hypothetical protein